MTNWIIDNNEDGHLGIINMCESATEEGTIIVDCRDLDDGANNTVDAVADKIRLVANLMANGYHVITRCQAGMSRSTTIATAALIYMGREQYWDDAWKATQQAVPRAHLNPMFFDVVKKALIKLAGSYKNGGLSMAERIEPIKLSPVTSSQTHGEEFYSEIGRKGGQKVRRLIQEGKEHEED